jgi:hypothetical protein
VGIDQAGHDPLAGRVEHLNLAAVFEPHIRRQWADALDAVAFDDDGIVAGGRLARSVDQGAVADHQGFLDAHGALLDLSGD